MEQAVEHRGDRGGIAEELPQSSTGRFEVSSVEALSYRRITISRRSSAAACGSLRMPSSSMMSSGTVVTAAT